MPIINIQGYISWVPTKVYQNYPRIKAIRMDSNKVEWTREMSISLSAYWEGFPALYDASFLWICKHLFKLVLNLKFPNIPSDNKKELFIKSLLLGLELLWWFGQGKKNLLHTGDNKWSLKNATITPCFQIELNNVFMSYYYFLDA